MAHFQQIKTKAQRRQSAARAGTGNPVLGFAQRRAFEWERRQLIAKHRGCCAACGCAVTLKDESDPTYATVDHIMPVSLGGQDSISNKQLLCRRCNQAKGGSHPDAWDPGS